MVEEPTSPKSADGDLEPVEAAMEAVATIFEVLGRALVCLDSEFRVIHVSPSFCEMAGDAPEDKIRGLPIQEILDPELFQPGSPFREGLEAGRRQEGWGATLKISREPARLVSVTGAPLLSKRPRACDPQVLYMLVLRPRDEEEADALRGPTLFNGMLARSTAMIRLFQLIENLSSSEATVLITGESGTGKELVARAIHQHSPRSCGSLVAVNCGAIPADLLESELFGHVRGAFTGAVRDREGRFEAAHGGTLFLDEVGDLPLPLQVKLLRVLQEGLFERVGETRPRRSDARILAATNRDLAGAVRRGEFREDLYYRLRVVPVDVPPLRARREDIEPLVRHFLARSNKRHRRALRLSPGALRRLLLHDWPGNVRELQNVLEYAVAVCREQTILEQDLPNELHETEGSGLQGTPASPATQGDPQADVERARILKALQTHQWRREPTALALGISRTTLWRKMKELGLDGPGVSQ